MNPFLISNSYISPEYFCDREQETATLLSNIRQQSNTAFFAQRRIGKTALIQHVFHHLRTKKTICIYLDLYPTRNLKDFSNQLATSIYGVFPPEKGAGKRFMEAIRLLRPLLSFDEISGSPQLTLDITRPRQIESTVPQLLRFLDSQKTRTVLAFDEFQQVLSYPEQNVEAMLRSVIQELRHVNFIFCGSNQELMHQIFNTVKRPFYVSTKNIHLRRIDSKPYANFIRGHFFRKATITGEAVELILELTDRHTYYTQWLCNELYASFTGKKISAEEVRNALAKILAENEGTYYQYRNLLTAGQWDLLKAVAEEGKVAKPFSHPFIFAHRLGSASSVKRSLDALIQKEMLYYDISGPDPQYEVYDKFLMHWLRSK